MTDTFDREVDEIVDEVLDELSQRLEKDRERELHKQHKFPNNLIHFPVPHGQLEQSNRRRFEPF